MRSNYKMNTEKSKSTSTKQKKTTLKKVWHFLWHSNSTASWFANLILAYLLIRFIVYPGLALVLGSQLPVVAVISGSMDHDLAASGTICGDMPSSTYTSAQFWDICGEWYEKRNISQEEFNTYSFNNGFSKGDIIFLRGKEIEQGDVVVFSTRNHNVQAEPIIHRVINIQNDARGTFYQTKGDHNPDMIKDNIIKEQEVRSEQILGVAWFKIPYLGYVKIGFVSLLTSIGVI